MRWGFYLFGSFFLFVTIALCIPMWTNLMSQNMVCVIFYCAIKDDFQVFFVCGPSFTRRRLVQSQVCGSAACRTATRFICHDEGGRAIKTLFYCHVLVWYISY